MMTFSAFGATATGQSCSSRTICARRRVWVIVCSRDLQVQHRRPIHPVSNVAHNDALGGIPAWDRVGDGGRDPLSEDSEDSSGVRSGIFARRRLDANGPTRCNQARWPGLPRHTWPSSAGSAAWLMFFLGRRRPRIQLPLTIWASEPPGPGDCAHEEERKPKRESKGERRKYRDITKNTRSRGIHE